MRILTVFGTRPEAIKMAPLVIKLREEKSVLQKICVTAQHRKMLDQVLSIFNIQPHYDLNIMRKDQSLNIIASSILVELKKIFDEFKPDLVLVQGDTTTTFATALASFYCGIKIGHVEAGLRTGNIQAPFPEEANRTLTTKIATYHFAPTQKNVDTLITEGVDVRNIVKTGNTVIDALLSISSKLDKIPDELKKSKIIRILDKNYKILLVTGHRRESFGQGFIEICDALSFLSKKYDDLQIIYPVHLNPNVRKPVFETISNYPNIHLIDPVSYSAFIYLMKKAYIILTDSGGVQEEAPSLGKPVLVMRDTTERPEAIEAGTVKLVGADRNKIIEGVSEILENRVLYEKMAKAINPYGDGKACERIVDFLKNL